MPAPSPRKLSVTEAAKILYKVDPPGPAHVEAVQRLLKIRQLGGHQDPMRLERWFTTTKDLAEYMASHAYRKLLVEAAAFSTGACSSPQATEPSPRNDCAHQAELVPLYRQYLSEYFQAVIFYRYCGGNGQRFQPAVLAGQVVLLLILVTLGIVGVVSLTAVRHPERAAVVKWMEDNVGEHAVEGWYPTLPAPQSRGLLVRVRYSYPSPRNKNVHTERLFLVKGDNARPVDSDGEQSTGVP